MTRTPILNGEAALLIQEGDCVTGIEFPNRPAADNPTEAAAITFNVCTARTTAEAIAKAFLGIA